jgi:hypothetical protein
MKQPNINEFKAWCRAHKGLAEAVCMAQAFAELERPRVDAYVLPIFERYEFKDEEGQPIPNPDRLYRCPDDAKCAAFYAECDAAHRANGFKGSEGVCPALQAENLVIEAEQALIRVAAVFFGIENAPLYDKKREQFLKLVLGACLQKEVA